MSKILILGSSHTGAFQTARHRIAAAFPALDVSYFGLPGSGFFNATLTQGVFAAPEDYARQFQWMETREIDLHPFERVLLVGERFAFGAVMRLLMGQDILEEPQRTKRPLMSRAAMQELIGALVEQRVEALLTKFGRDTRFTFVPAPYPLARSLQSGPGQEKALKSVLKRDTGADWGRTYEARIASEMAAAGLDFLAQPRETRDSYLTTQDRFARQDAPEEASETQIDNRHMNDDYGWQVFCAYAATRLEIRPELEALADETKTGSS